MNYPTRHSDIDCDHCGLWFRTTGELMDHIESAHPEECGHQEVCQ